MGQNKARKVEMSSDRDGNLEPIIGSSLCTDECRFKLRRDIRVWIRRSQIEGYNHRCTLSSSKDASLLGCHCLGWDGAPHQSTRKLQFVGLNTYFGRSRSSVFTLKLGFKLVDDNAPIHRFHTVNEWKLVMASNLFHGQRTVRI